MQGIAHYLPCIPCFSRKPEEPSSGEAATTASKTPERKDKSSLPPGVYAQGKNRPPSLNQFNGREVTSRPESTSNSSERHIFSSSQHSTSPLRGSFDAMTKSHFGKTFHLSEKVLDSMAAFHDAYPNKEEVNLLDLNNDKGAVFVRRAMGEMRFQKKSLQLSAADIPAMYEVYDALCSKADPLELMKDISVQVRDTVKKLAEATTDREVKKIVKEKNQADSQLWADWQHLGEKLLKTQGHKAIYERYPVTMEELSNLHRDVEALTLLLESVFPDPDDEEAPKPALVVRSIKTHVQTMIASGILEKVSQPPSPPAVRNDIPSKESDYDHDWRKLRTAPGSRQMDVLNAFFAKDEAQ